MWVIGISHLPCFVQVGRLPEAPALNTYFLRLREQGWNIHSIVERILIGGAVDLSDEVKGGWCWQHYAALLPHKVLRALP